MTSTLEVPAITLLTSVVYPHDVVSIQLGEDEVEAAALGDGEAEHFVVTLFSREGEGPVKRKEEAAPVGVLCRIVQRMQMPGGAFQAVFQGVSRVRLVGLRREGAVTWGRVETLTEQEATGAEADRLVLELLDLLAEFLPRDNSYPEDLESILRMNMKGPGRFADLVAAYLNLDLVLKREICQATSIEERLAILAGAIRGELRHNSIDADVQRKVRSQIEERQREQYLRQQMRAIRRELGDDGSPEDESEELLERLRGAGLPKEAREIAEREIRRLRSVPQSSAEYQVVRSYAGWLLDLPWKKRTRDRLDLPRARAILEERHSGLGKVKERILEHLAVRKLRRNARGPILCLVGPPGVGKTSLGKAVAEALGRKFVRMSVGGLRDEAEIKGHRRTYVGAMPGKVLQLMKHAGVRNPVLQIDEIDKMGSDARGDPSSAMLEVLDPEVNSEFRDHYLDAGYDLSDVFFLVTANLAEAIPTALRDRLEIVRLGGYTRHEKLAIARHHLVPRAIENNGLRSGQVRFTAGGLATLIDGHTREAGLRELERNLNAICRKVATRYVEGHTSPVSVGRNRVQELLGPAPYRADLAGRQPEVGVATGLAWTAYGGALLQIEATRMPGKGVIQVTGRLGEVMQESAQAAFTFIRANAEEFDLDPALFRESDVHIHFPEGATPKDGPSAGVAVATCLASLFTRRAVRHDLAMTGELTLKGRVLEVGGIKEKLLAAHRAGIRRVIIPRDNLKDLVDLPAEVRKDLEIVGSEEVMTNICEALLSIVVPEHGTLAEVDAPSHVTAQPIRRALSNRDRSGR
ncbi:MAG: endopeptidase La [Planctomycetes bacterium]|nr:endopeptidase La [Planctomycetota bacterium]